MIIATAACAALPAADALQFDLKCDGRFEDRAQDKTGRFSERVRVDLEKGRFCIEECQNVLRLTRFDDRTIEYRYDPTSSDPMLRAQPPYGPRQDMAAAVSSKSAMTFDRRTGSYRRTEDDWAGDIVGVHHDERFAGSCVRMPFSGLPAPDRYHRWSN